MAKGTTDQHNKGKKTMSGKSIPGRKSNGFSAAGTNPYSTDRQAKGTRNAKERKRS